MIDVFGIHSKKHIMKYLRDGNDYFKQNEEFWHDYEHMTNPDERCVRHDRHLQYPHERNVPPPVLIQDNNMSWIETGS